MADSAPPLNTPIAILEPNRIDDLHEYILGKWRTLTSAVGYVISPVGYLVLYGKKVLFKIE